MCSTITVPCTMQKNILGHEALFASFTISERVHGKTLNYQMGTGWETYHRNTKMSLMHIQIENFNLQDQITSNSG